MHNVLIIAIKCSNICEVMISSLSSKYDNGQRYNNADGSDDEYSLRYNKGAISTL